MASRQHVKAIVPVVDALSRIGYQGYASAEALPYPNPEDAARQTMEKAGVPIVPGTTERLTDDEAETWIHKITH